MFSNITIGKYIYKDSLIHKIHPIIKIIIVLLLLITTLFLGFIKNTIIFLLINIILYLSKIDLKTYYKNIYGFRFLIIGIIIIELISKMNIILIFNNVLVLMLNLLITGLLMYTTSIDELNYGINRLMSPLKYLKINYNKISIIITLSIKFIFIVFEEADILFKSFKSRGLRFKGNIKQRIKQLQMFLTTLLYLLLKKADDISDILKMRRYEFDKLLFKNKTKIKFIDILSMLLVISFIILIGVI